MIDHVVVNVEDIGAAKAFYVEALAPLGYEVIMEFPQGVGFGREGKPDFWVALREPYHSGVHVAFSCDRRELVDAFYEAAMAAQGRDNGPPGVRERYHPHYYGAFVLDPAGNNIEAVCHLHQEDA